MRSGRAERVWRLDHPTYTDPTTLATAGLIDPMLASADGPYRFEVDAGADFDAFRGRAIRVGGGSWAGTLAIDASGILTGAIYHADADAIQPGYQFIEH